MLWKKFSKICPQLKPSLRLKKKFGYACICFIFHTLLHFLLLLEYFRPHQSLEVPEINQRHLFLQSMGLLVLKVLGWDFGNMDSIFCFLICSLTSGKLLSKISLCFRFPSVKQLISPYLKGA